MRWVLLALSLLVAPGAQALRLTPPAGEQAVTAAEPLTLVFEVHNDTPAEWSGQPSLELPPGWAALFAPEALTLAPGARQVLLLPVSPPPTAAAGAYPVTLLAGDVRATALLRLSPHRDVKLQCLDGDHTVLDGRFRATFSVLNSGNVAEALSLNTDPSGLTVSPAQLSLPPGGRATITVTGTLPASKDTTRQVALHVQGQGGLTRTVRLTATALLSELPLAERALTLKGGLRFSAGSTPHAELALSGRLHPDLPGTVDLVVSDTTWRVRYRTPAVALAAGSLSHPGLSLQPGTSLFGVSGALRQGPWQAEASAGTDQGAFAGGVTLRYGAPQMDAALGLVTSRRGPTLAAEVTGRRGRLRAWASGALDLSTGAPRAAFGVTYHDRLNAATLSAAYRAAHFQGQVGADVTVKAEVRHHFGGNLTGAVAAEYQQSPRSPGAPAKLTVSGRLADPLAALDVAVTGAGGQVTDARLRHHNATWDTRVNWAPGTVQIQTTPTVAAGPVTLRPTLGAQVSLPTATVRPALGLAADWATRHGAATLAVMSPTTAGTPWTVTGGIDLKLKQADLAVSGAIDVGAAVRPRLRAVLSYPLELITGRRKTLGRIEGRVQRPGGQPLAGLRLRAGSLTTTTDTAGRFVFPDVPQGRVQLDLVDKGTLVGLRARPALPLQIDVGADQTTAVDLRLTPGVSVQGRVLLDWPTPEADLGKRLVPDAPALETLVVRLRGPEVSYEAALTDGGGFSLSGVQPGTYEVVFSVAGTILLTTARPSTSTLTVPEADTLQVSLHLLPVVQELRIEDGGEIKLK